MVAYPRIRVRRSNASRKWYVVIQTSKHKSACVALSLTFQSVCIVAEQIKHAFAAITRPTCSAQLDSRPVTQWSRWRHYNGVVYIVASLTNEHSANFKYPVTVVYFNERGERKLWSRPLVDWHRSMHYIGDQIG